MPNTIEIRNFRVVHLLYLNFNARVCLYSYISQEKNGARFRNKVPTIFVFALFLAFALTSLTEFERASLTTNRMFDLS